MLGLGGVTRGCGVSLPYDEVVDPLQILLRIELDDQSTALGALTGSFSVLY